MAGTVFLKTNRFEVKLEGITFKAKDFERLCAMDFLFPKGKVWLHPPVVGLDVMRHPRDPNILLMLLCFGVGCVILRFRSGESLSEPIFKFLTDERIRFVGFGIPEKKDLFPFEELGLTKSKADIGYMAAKLRNDPKYAKCELAELARKVLGIKEMVGLTEASSFERHEQLKCAICQLFMSSVIAMSLLRLDNKKILADSPKKNSFLKTLNSLPLLNEGWFKTAKGKKDNNKSFEVIESFYDFGNEAKYTLADDYVQAKGKVGFCSDDPSHIKNKDGDSSDESGKENASPSKKPLKGILKSCPFSGMDACKSSPSTPSSPPSGLKDQRGGPNLKRANSKGHNVSFKQ